MKTYASREEVPVHEKWNLVDIYSDVVEWEEDFSAISKNLTNLKEYDGAIHDGKTLYAYLTLREGKPPFKQRIQINSSFLVRYMYQINGGAFLCRNKN